MKRFQDDALATWMACSANLQRVIVIVNGTADRTWVAEGVLLCNFTQLWFTLWAIGVGIAKGIHNYLCIGTSATAIHLVGKLVAQEHERHEVTSD